MESSPTRYQHSSGFKGALSAVILGVIIVCLGWGGRLVGIDLATLALLVGGALATGGLVSLLFSVLAHRSVEWLLAWRYLRDETRTSRVPLVVGLAIVAISAVLFLASKLVGYRVEEIFVDARMSRVLEWISYIGFIVAAWIIFFGLLLRFGFSVFTSISVFGVFLGTCALVVVLSVMGGFKQDIREKILGTRAHVVVTKEKRAFTEYRQVAKEIASVIEKRGLAPYVESEVMITSQSNLSGVLLKGIDPKTINRVSDLQKYLRTEDGLKNLANPERLARLPLTPFKTMVSDPMGEPPKKVLSKTRKVDEKNAKTPPRGKLVKKVNEADSQNKNTDGTGPDGKDDLLSGKKLIDEWSGVGDKVPPRPVYPGVLVGAELARNLHLYVGDDVNLVAPLGGMSPVGPLPKSRIFRIAGVFYSGMYEYDTRYAYVTIPAAQSLLGLGDEVTGIEIKGASPEEATSLAMSVRQALGKRYEVRDWLDLNSSLLSALKLEKVVMFFVLVFIILVASLSIITNLVMVVLEKTREIAALKAVGARHGALLRVFVYAGIYIGTIGTLAGILAGIGICTFLTSVGLPLNPEVWYISQLPVRMDWPDILAVSVAAVTLSFLATLYPAFVASRIQPVDGLRFQG
ncbi:MAG: ABC transporter permease [Pseudomonadota bacterium]